MKTLTLISFIFIFINTVCYSSEIVEIYLLDNLDDERGYCLDIKGHKSRAKIEKGLQAHTCYSYQGGIAVDQGFDKDKLSNSMFFIPGFSACIKTSFNNLETKIILDQCDDKNSKYLIFSKTGEIYLENDNSLCLTVSNKNSRKGKGGVPLHNIKNIEFQKCKKDISKFQLWGIR